MSNYILHHDEKPIGVFETLGEAQNAGEEKIDGESLIHIESAMSTPARPVQCKGWFYDYEVSAWVETPLPA